MNSSGGYFPLLNREISISIRSSLDKELSDDVECGEAEQPLIIREESMNVAQSGSHVDGKNRNNNCRVDFQDENPK